jgi:hypothetical protein
VYCLLVRLLLPDDGRLCGSLTSLPISNTRKAARLSFCTEKATSSSPKTKRAQENKKKDYFLLFLSTFQTTNSRRG